MTERRQEALLFALLLLTYAWFYQGGFSNQNARFDLTLALALEHRATVDTFAANTIDKVVVGGHAYLEKAPGASWTALPVALLASPFLSASDLRASPWLGDLLLWAGTVASVSALTAASAVAFRRTLRLLNPGLPGATATILALAVFGGTLLLPYATMLFGHAVAASSLMLGVAALLRAAAGPRQGAERSASLGWLALGAVVLTEYPLAVATLGAAAAALLSSPDRERRVLLLVRAPLGALPVLGILLHNTVVFGGPLSFGYGKLQDTPFSSGMSRGLFGIALPSPHVALQLLFGTYRGLFVYSPLLLVAVACLRAWPRPLRRTVAAPLGLACLGLLGVISGYAFWQGGTCFGPRHLVGIVPLLGLGLAFLPASWARSPLFLGVVALSAAVSLLGTVITPNVTEFELAPLTRAYLPLLASGEVSISPMAFLTPATETAARHVHYRAYPWAAFNVGELLGLRGWWSVLPLGIVWVAALRALARADSPSREGTT